MKNIRLPLPIRAWNAIGPAINKIGFKSELELSSLLEQAQKEEELNDFGDEYFIEPLNRLLISIEEEAQLHTFGQFVTRQRLIGLLRNRLRAEYYFQKHPEILEINLEAPIVIAGLQRTGTTFLHRLIASHSQIRSLKSWEALNPAPFKNWDRKTKDKRIAEGRKAEKGLKFLNPSFFAIHPVEHNSPEEEVLLLDVSFLSTVAEATLHVPTFAKWLEEQDQTPSYQYMKKLLQLLTWQRGSNHWVLKTPHHLEYLDVLRNVFPKSTIIQTHRDPRITVPSLASMIWHGRFIFTDKVDAQQVGNQWLDKITLMLKKSSDYRSTVNSEGFIDLNYENLISNPYDSVQEIYSRIGLESSERDKEILLKILAEQRKDRYGVHRYDMADFGLSEELIKHRLGLWLD